MQTVNEAKRLYNAGSQQDAAVICEQLLKTNPSNDEACNLLSIIHFSQGKLESAERLMQQAVHAKPDNLTRVYNYARILQAQRRHSEAEQLFRNILAAHPDFPEAFFCLGQSLQEQQKIEEAAAAYGKAARLKPSYIEALFNLGVMQRWLGRVDDSLATFLNIHSSNPTHVETLFNIGIDCQISNRFREAIQAYEAGLNLAPQNASILYNLGIVYQSIEDYNKAAEYFRRTLAIAPNHLESLNNLGLTLYELRSYDEAITCFNQALEIKPDFTEALSNLGNVFLALDRYEEAGKNYTATLALDKDFVKAHYNLGNLFWEQCKPKKAIEAYRHALKLDPQLAETNWNLGNVLLLTGNYEEGWKYYQWRWKRKETPPPFFPKPEWLGENLPDGTLLVHTEQGLGDSIQFIRYLPLLKQKVGRVILMCETHLMDLFADVRGIDQLLTKGNSKADSIPYNMNVPLLSLPGIFKTDLETIPSEVPYLTADPEKVKNTAHLFAEAQGKIKVGIVWQGNPQHKNDAKRSCPLELFFPLTELSHVQLFSLQLQSGLLPPDKITDLSPAIQSFADTAALIEHLDLVISVDTSVAHLAGALGKPVWLLLPRTPDWRWLLDREDSPWYPSARLFRQKNQDDWAQVFRMVQQELAVWQAPPRQTSVAPNVTDASQQSALSCTAMPHQDETLYVGLSSGENFGWGVCSKYLSRLLACRRVIHLLNTHDGSAANSQLPGTLFQAITGIDMLPLYGQAKGKRNIGYTFFENELTDVSLANAGRYDLILAGSSWCRERLLEKGIPHCDTLIQGIDPEIFFPMSSRTTPEKFVIFSGGKFEMRKGQDLVLKAFKILQDKYDDIYLVNCWQNIWPKTMEMMALSPHIRYEYKHGSWQDTMRHLYDLNGIDPARVETLPLTDNATLREIYSQTDIGLFPNRCEGGTNLVLMEYMACAKTVIAANATGHTDVLTADNALPLNTFSELNIANPDGSLSARWVEPSLDEIIAQVEFAYHNRDILRTLGQRAGKDLQQFTWQKSAARLLELLA